MLLDSVLQVLSYGRYGGLLGQDNPICRSSLIDSLVAFNWRHVGHSPLVRISPTFDREVPLSFRSAWMLAGNQRLDLHPILLTFREANPDDRRIKRYHTHKRQQGCFFIGCVALGAPSGPIEHKQVEGVLLFSVTGRRLLHWNIPMENAPAWHGGVEDMARVLLGPAPVSLKPKDQLRWDAIQKDPLTRLALPPVDLKGATVCPSAASEDAPLEIGASGANSLQKTS